MKKIKNSQPQTKFTGSYKKRVYFTKKSNFQLPNHDVYIFLLKRTSPAFTSMTDGQIRK